MPEDLEFVVLTGGRTRNNCPTSVVVKTKEEYSGNIWLRNEDSGLIYPGYAYRLDEDHLEIFVILNNLNRESELELTLSEDQPTIDKGNFLIMPMELKQKDENIIEIKKNGSLFTRFHYNDAVRPYLMPLMGPFDEPVTREYPLKEISGGSSDHIHHRSLWAAWGDVNGADNWSEAITGVPQILKEVTIKEAGYALTHIQAKIEWMDRDGEDPNLDEIRDIFIYNLLGKETILDVRNKFIASYEDVKFGDTKEAGIIAVRVADAIRGSHGGLIENGLGAEMEDYCWGKKASWVDYSGMVGGHKVGVSVMDHPDNPGYPCRWHIRNYGLIGANPWSTADFLNDKSKTGTFLLKKGESINFNYRVFVHAGNSRDSNVSAKYSDFIIPPEMKHLSF
jgi:Family of unknown function (DUF6807)